MSKRHTSAARKFEAIYNACAKDGIIDKSEAKLLVERHNDLQRESRDALREKLLAYGWYDITAQLESGIIADPKRKSQAPDPMYMALHMEEESNIPKRPEPNYYRPGNRMIGQKTKFFLITGPAIVVTLLRLLGVF